VAKSNRWRITTMTEPTGGSFIGRVMDSPAPAMLMLLSLLIGVVALWLTPREEEPQIVVPIADVIVSAPGLSAQQVERQIAVPMEKLLYQIDGVEYVYSASHNGRCVVTVRYHVGEDREESLFKIYNKVFSNVDRIPAAVESWVVKPNEIDDVPIVVAALWSDDPERFDDHDLRRLAEELELELQSITATNRVSRVRRLMWPGRSRSRTSSFRPARSSNAIGPLSSMPAPSWATPSRCARWWSMSSTAYPCTCVT